MTDCPFCANTMPCGCLEEGHEGFSERLESDRRFQGEKNVGVTRDNMTGALKFGQYVVDTGGARPEYYLSKLREFNDEYNGSGRGTW